MDRVTVHINRPVGSGGTGVFAGAATDAERLPHFRDPQTIAVWNPVNGVGGTGFFADAASDVVGMDNAVGADEVGHAELNALFGGQTQRTDRAGRADLAATIALVTAIAGYKIQAGLQQPGQAVFQQRWLQYAIGTGAHA